ncbi:hypothetical protein TTHERM_00499640 (macronuclear) [Tetrahymena thermophila SB210]|uniref:Uncharacterized protein n=1 Tax=Tetrahymena thermophila (strain SB210) TaxID=312017 RepID=I7LWJ0_TETTS|nr:hypothetical protein TTHERM_00499640 [Tetrahymena thermophila SB210]EAS01977.1 hypothetical protein TTHERM_00499640 [Tetrahymena thermophila SB210]|eukprot:XP_001022222.1 hypothetical protein TTHERM_00499640 [Tetrahymena thermophila SB210]
MDRNKEENNLVKSDYNRINFDFDFDIDVSGANVNNTDYESEANKILSKQEQQIAQNNSSRHSRKQLTKNEREVISEIFKSQTDKDIYSICESVITKNKGQDNKTFVLSILSFLDQIGLFGNSNMISDVEIDYNQYFQFVQTKYNQKLENAKSNVPQYVKAFYEYLLTYY